MQTLGIDRDFVVEEILEKLVLVIRLVIVIIDMAAIRDKFVQRRLDIGIIIDFKLFHDWSLLPVRMVRAWMKGRLERGSWNLLAGIIENNLRRGAVASVDLAVRTAVVLAYDFSRTFWKVLASTASETNFVSACVIGNVNFNSHVISSFD
jgi:hypothetical protein